MIGWLGTPLYPMTMYERSGGTLTDGSDRRSYVWPLMVLQDGIDELKFVMTSCERTVDAVSTAARIAIPIWNLTFMSVVHLNLRLEWRGDIELWSYGGEEAGTGLKPRC